jgi:hypothetical protein
MRPSFQHLQQVPQLLLLEQLVSLQLLQLNALISERSLSLHR